MTAYIFILAMVMGDGSFKVNHVIIPECPSQQEVTQFMEEKVKSGEVKQWGGSCTLLVDPKTKEM